LIPIEYKKDILKKIDPYQKENPFLSGLTLHSKEIGLGQSQDD